VEWVGTIHPPNCTPIKHLTWKYCLTVIKFTDLGCWLAKLLAATALLNKNSNNSLKLKKQKHLSSYGKLSIKRLCSNYGKVIKQISKKALNIRLSCQKTN